MVALPFSVLHQPNPRGLGYHVLAPDEVSRSIFVRHILGQVRGKKGTVERRPPPAVEKP